jgi:hypothetical protein
MPLRAEILQFCFIWLGTGKMECDLCHCGSIRDQEMNFYKGFFIFKLQNIFYVEECQQK